MNRKLPAFQTYLIFRPLALNALAIMFISGFFAACEGSSAPMDAETRQAIDSIATAQISTLRVQLDTQCAQRHRTELPLLIDSIRQKRLKEINEKLKGVVK